jgi:hypothetical protein
MGEVGLEDVGEVLAEEDEGGEETESEHDPAEDV